MHTLLGSLVLLSLGGCNRDPLQASSGDDAQVPLDLGVAVDLSTPRRDLYQPPDLQPRPDLLGPVPPLRFAPPLYQGHLGNRTSVGDFDGDGRMDVVSAGNLGVSVALQRQARWMVPIDTPIPLLGTGDAFHAVADFDDDGKLDVVVAGAIGTIVTFHGLGDGQFRIGASTAGIDGTASLSARDLDGDGRLDLVLSSWANPSVAVLRGKGDGTFGLPSFTRSGTGHDAVVADIDGDGRLDVAVAGERGIALLPGVGDGTFKAPVDYRLGYSNRVLGADFDRDGRADLLLTTDDSLTLVRSTRNGLVADPPIAVPRRIGDVVTGDWNSDGNPDLAVTRYLRADALAPVIPFLGDGKGSFARGAEVATLGVVASLAMGDVDGDKHPDLVVGGSAMQLLRNDGAGNFGGPRIVALSTYDGHAVLADVDHDGQPDVLSWMSLNAGTPLESSFLLAFPSEGGGRYRQATLTATPRFTHLAVGGVDGDRHLDVVGLGKEQILCWPGKGDGSFGLPVSSPAHPWVNLLYAPLLGDLDGDGWLDVVAADMTTLVIAFGDSRCGFRTVHTLPLGQSLTNPIVGDWNGDGRTDLAAFRRMQGVLEVVVIDNQGHGAFAAPRAVLAGVYARALATADFDGDGLLDLAVIPDGPTVSVLRGLPGGGLAQPLSSDLGIQPRLGQVVAADFNGDGRPDLAVAGEKLGVLAGNGDGTFLRPEQAFDVEGFTMSLSAVDVDVDGDLDLVRGAMEGNWLTTYVNHLK